MATDEMSDAVVIHKEQQLYLKHISRMVIIIQLPEIKTPGYTVSNWEVMEKLKSCICPNVFSFIKVTKSSIEFLHFEAEAESKDQLQKFIKALDGKCLKLSGISEPLKVKAGKAKTKFPKKHDWIAFFRDSGFLDESKHGERPDTVHVKGLPLKWFSDQKKKNHDTPSEHIVREFFEAFGGIRNVDIPILDKYRPRMNLQNPAENADFRTFSFGSNLYFDAFIQYLDYTGFEKAMLGLKNRKLVHVLDDEKLASANLDVDFDQTAHLSAKNISKRNALRNKLIASDQEEAELAEKARLEEERLKEFQRLEELRKEEERKQKIEEEKQLKRLQQLKKIEKKKVARLKEKLLRHEKRKQLIILEKKRKRKIAEKKADAKRLILAILEVVSEKKKQEKIEKRKRKKELEMLQELEQKKLKKEEDEKIRKEFEAEQKAELEDKEKNLRSKIMKNIKEMEETKQELQRELLRRKLSSSKKSLSSVATMQTQ